jgi:hypothetical protein
MRNNATGNRAASSAANRIEPSKDIAYSAHSLFESFHRHDFNDMRLSLIVETNPYPFCSTKQLAIRVDLILFCWTDAS